MVQWTRGETLDFKAVLEKVLRGFEELEVHYALIGGFALGLWGLGRATMDLDFLILKDDMPKVDNLFRSLGYTCAYRSENVSQYVSPLGILGTIDCLHAFRKATLAMLERAEEKAIFQGKLRIRVAQPEDLIGLKFQAMRNDPSRKDQDLADVKGLVRLFGGQLDWSRIREYAEILDMEEVYEEIAASSGSTERTQRDKS